MESNSVLSKKVLVLMILMTFSAISISSKSTSDWHTKLNSQYFTTDPLEEFNSSLDTLKYYTQKLKEQEGVRHYEN